MAKERTITRAEPVASVGLHDRERGYVSAIHSQRSHVLRGGARW